LHQPAECTGVHRHRKSGYTKTTVSVAANFSGKLRTASLGLQTVVRTLHEGLECWFQLSA